MVSGFAVYSAVDQLIWDEVDRSHDHDLCHKASLYFEERTWLSAPEAIREMRIGWDKSTCQS